MPVPRAAALAGLVLLLAAAAASALEPETFDPANDPACRGGEWLSFIPVEQRLETRLQPFIQAHRARRSSHLITVDFQGSWNSAQRAEFSAAAEAWEAALVSWKPNVETALANSGYTTLTISARSEFIDGSGGILGSAGPRTFFNINGVRVAVTGAMRFDSADLADALSSGYLFDLILHEMGHVIGIGTLWDHVYDSSRFRFTGSLATSMYQREFDQTTDYVPVERDGGPGTAGGHWDENFGSDTGIVNVDNVDFKRELMTGWLNIGSFMSAMTVEALRQMGFVGFAKPSGFCVQDSDCGGGTCSGGEPPMRTCEGSDPITTSPSTTHTTSPSTTQSTTPYTGPTTTPSTTPSTTPAPACGDKSVDSGEECDDGNLDDGDGCSSTCEIEEGWKCQTRRNCRKMKPKCGDGLVVGNEQCDDGNRKNKDGCNKQCKIQRGWRCVGTGPCTRLRTVCGDGIVAGNEKCDDGNKNNGDGCNKRCKVQRGWSCRKRRKTPQSRCTEN